MAYSEEKCNQLRLDLEVAEAERDKRLRYLDAYEDIEVGFLQESQTARQQILDAQAAIQAAQAIVDEQTPIEDLAMRRADSIRARVDNKYQPEYDNANDTYHTILNDIVENCE